MAEYTRDVFVPGLEIREGQRGEPTLLVGYAAVFNQETVIQDPEGAWRERIMPGAFADVIDADDVIAAVNHDKTMVLGRSKRGTLRLSTDSRGLRYEVVLPNTTLARDTVENVRNGNYPGSSFRFSAERSGISVERSRDHDLPLIRIQRVKSLRDVGPVTFPAYEGTSVSVRAMAEMVADALKLADVECERGQAERDRVALRIRLELAKAWQG